MSTAGDDISATALAIAIVALVIAISQALQQYFSTADGFRRCRADVIGGWSAWNDSKFDWRNLRFETLFSTPQISLGHPLDMRDGRLPIGHEGLPRSTSSKSDIQSIKASWLDLLEHTKGYQEGIYAAFVREPANNGNEGGDDAEKGQVQQSMDQWSDGTQSTTGDSSLAVPMAKPTKISWDFMP